MGLLNQVKEEKAQVKATAPVTEGTTTAAKKKSNSDYQKRQREHQYAAACTIRDFLKTLKDVKLPENVQAELDFLCKERKASAAGSAFGKPVIYKLFGDAPKAGDSVTALKVFELTGKGFQEMRQLMKKWTEKHDIVVKYDEVSKAYKIESGTIPAYNA